MGFQETFRKITQFVNKGEIEQIVKPIDRQALSPEVAEMFARRQLLRLFTDQKMLESLGGIGRTLADFQRATKNLCLIQAEYGIKSDLMPTLTADLGGAYIDNMAGILANRELALSVIPENKRPIIEGEVLLIARDRLTESLKQSGLSRDYYNGASEMLERIENHLKTDIAPTEKNSK